MERNYWIIALDRLWVKQVYRKLPIAYEEKFMFLIGLQWAIPEIRGTPLKKTNIF